MRAIIIEDAKNIMSNPYSPNRYFGWPSVARLQDGRIAAVASGFRMRHVCPFGKAVISFSSDNGKTYSLPAPVIDTHMDDRDAGITPFGESGLIVTSFTSTLALLRRNALTEASDPAPVKAENVLMNAYLDTVSEETGKDYHISSFRVSFDCGTTFGPIHSSPVTSPHGPVCLSCGSILWVGTNFSDDEGSQGRISAYEIFPDGRSVLRGSVPPIPELFNCEPHCIELDDGTLLCHLRLERNGYFSIAQTESKDGGRTWTQPLMLLPKTGGSPPHLLQLKDGTVVCTYGYRKEPYGIRAMVSHDRGKTWETDIVVWDKGASGDLGYPCSIELDDGSILTVFYGRAKDDKDVAPFSTQPANFIKQIIWRPAD